MPALKKFDANVARHVKLMNKNLCANLIRHEYIVTGRTKAKRAQLEIESFLGKALHQNRVLKDEPLATRYSLVSALNYLQPPDKREVGMKVLGELSERYADRTHGFTRIIKLEPRLGEDKAPMSVLELVDLDFEIKFWYTAKIVARLELQGLPVDALTQKNVDKLTALRPGGAARFREAVEEAKVGFFAYNPETQQVEDPAVEENLANKPAKVFEHPLARRKHFRAQPRSEPVAAAVPKSPFLE